MIFDFETKLAEGQQYEQRLDGFFARYDIDIRPATMEEQRQGIDRFFTSRTTGTVDAVEYKADSRAGQTGNAFIETVSVDTTGKPGWAVASRARYLVYLVTEPEAVYLVPMRRLRLQINRWQREYPTGSAANGSYTTKGLLVPLRELEKIAVMVW
jgi:hypothetical protein